MKGYLKSMERRFWWEIVKKKKLCRGLAKWLFLQVNWGNVWQGKNSNMQIDKRSLIILNAMAGCWGSITIYVKGVNGYFFWEWLY